MANIERFSILVTERGSRSVGRSIRGIGNAAAFSVGRIRLLVGSLGILGTAFSVAKLFQLADGFTTIANQVRLVTKDSNELTRVQAQIFRVAQETRIPLAETTVLYRRLALSTRDLKLEQGDLIDITRTTNKLIQVSGATAIEAKQGIIQLSQGIASGTLRGDELRSVLEQIPRIGVAIADSLEKTFGDLRELGKQGKLTGVQVLRALLKAAEEANEEFEKLTPTIGQSFQVLENEIQQTLGILLVLGDDPILGQISKKMIDLSKNIDILVSEALANLIEGFAGVLSTGADVVETMEIVGITFDNVLKSVQAFASTGKTALQGFGTGVLVLKVALLELLLAKAEFDAADGATPAAVGLAFAPGGGVGAAGVAAEGAARIVASQEVADITRRLTIAQIDLAVSAERTQAALIDTGNTIIDLAVDTDEAGGSTLRLSDRLKELAERAPAVAAVVRALGIKVNELKNAEDTLTRGGGDLKDIPKPLTAAELARLEAARKKLDQEFEGFLDKLFEPDDLLRLNAALEGAVEDAITDGVGAGFRALLDGEVLDFAEIFSNILKDALTAQLTNTLRDSLLGVKGDAATGEGTTQGLFRSIFGTAAPTRTDDPAGDTSGNFLSDNAAGIGSLIVAGGLIAQGFASTSSSVSSSIQKSAVDSIEASRGVVVGPQDIAIFKVGDAIADAFIPIQSLAIVRNDLLTQILAAVRLNGGGVSDASLDAQIASEFNTASVF
jgi:tape measure domain-containing protein